MSEGFAKDSRACAACTSWSGERVLTHGKTLASVANRQVVAECRGPGSPNYKKLVRAFHTCTSWAPMPLLRAHGGRPDLPVRSPPPPAPAPGVAAPRYQSRLYPIDRSPPPVTRLYDYWLDRKGNRQLPDRRLIQPADLKDYLGFLSLLEVVRGGEEFIFRLHGSRLAPLLAINPIGKGLADLGNPELAQFLRADLRSCVERRSPECTAVTTDLFRLPVNFFRLALPLGDVADDGRVSFLCVYTHVLSEARAGLLRL